MQLEEQNNKRLLRGEGRSSWRLVWGRARRTSSVTLKREMPRGVGSRSRA